MLHYDSLRLCSFSLTDFGGICDCTYRVLLQTKFINHSTKDASESKKKWFPFNKGGTYRKWYGNQELVVNYENDGESIKEDVLRKYPYLKNPDFVVKNSVYYFENGLTWSALSNEFSIRKFDWGAICADKGQGLYASEDTQLYCCGLLNSCIATLFLQMISPTLDFNCGYIRKIPYCTGEAKQRDIIVDLVKHNVSMSRTDWDAFETSWDFTTHPLVELSRGLWDVSLGCGCFLCNFRLIVSIKSRHYAFLIMKPSFEGSTK